jgi:hypothetical protein
MRNSFVEKIKEEIKTEPPIIYHLIDNSDVIYHKVNRTAVNSIKYQTEIKMQIPFYKPLHNINF